MNVLRVLDSSGDTVVKFNDNEVEARKQAKELFDRLLVQGKTAFRTGENGGKITSFDQVQGEVVIIPRVVAG